MVVTKPICRMAISLLALGLWSSISLSQNSPPRNPVVRVDPVKGGECDPCDRMAVIFVHGIGGSSTTTWTNTNGTYWPNVLANDPEIGTNIDIYAVKYDSSLLWSKSSIIDIMKRIDLELDSFFYFHRYQKVSLICHSMGGIVCTSYLLHVKARYGHRVLAKFRLVFAMAVPYSGSEYANFRRIFKWSSAQTRILVPIDQNDFGQLLRLTTREILEKQRDQHCPLLTTYAGYEEQALQSYDSVPDSVLRRLNLIIVKKESAIAGVNENNIRGFQRDHFTLVEPSGATDDVNIWVRDNLKACIDGTTVCKGRLQDAEFNECGRPLGEFPHPGEVTTDPADVLFKP